MLATLPLNHLRAFEAAARHQSFAAAAAELYVTPAAISHRIKELESALGLLLFERRNRGVELTPAGRGYGEEIAAALARIEQATDALARPPIDGPLRISLPQSMAQRWLAPRLQRLCRRYPGLDLQIDADDQLADLRGGAADLAIRFGQGHYPGLRVRHLMNDAVSLLISAELLAQQTDTSPAALARQLPLLTDRTVGSAEPWMSWGPWLREIGLTEQAPRRQLQFSDSAMVIAACRANAGIGIGRLSLALELLNGRQLVALAPWRSTDYAHYLLTRQADGDSPRIAAFAEWLQTEVADYARRAQALCGLSFTAAG